MFTSNQVMEDEVFYKKIDDLPVSFKGMYLDKYDAPLKEIRKRVDSSYYLVKEEDEK